ncbi:MAG: hypothetical protein WBD20_13365 [Pirellulaceae bacterium]
MERIVRYGFLLCVVGFGILQIDSDCMADIASTAKTPVKVTPLKKGDSAGAFYVTKVAGAEDDDVQVGQELCYRCRYGSRPIVMVFARHTNGDVSKLMQQVDNAIENNKESQLRGLVTLLGDDVAQVKKDAQQIAEKTGVKHTPVVIAKEIVNGPANYKLSKTADVTVVIASDSKVVSSTIYSAESIDVAAIMTEVNVFLK